jgi:hypothetical protein
VLPTMSGVRGMVAVSRSSLESPTKLDRAKVPAREARWLLKLYPDAAEAGGCFQGNSDPRPGASWEIDPERSANEAARRARRQLRRYGAANRLNRLATLTYGPPFCRDPRAVRSDVGAFFRRLRRRLGRPLPYLWVPELHADGERYHVHFAVGRYVPRAWIEDAWGHGFVHIKLLGDLPTGSGSLGEARMAARYLAKYAGKALDRGPAGLHRYEVAQGFGPRAVALVGATAQDVLAQASAVMGSEPELVWYSSNEQAWAGPHAVWATWTR